jgi:flagellar basal body rod protein FlgG
MSYGLQISASGVMASLYRQDVLANNLANMDTAGFKPEIPKTIPRQAVRQEDGVGFLPSNAMLERLGAGVLLHPNRLKMAQGGLRSTGRDLDVAIRGQGFLATRDPQGKNANSILLTRDGRLARSSQGLLVLAGSGAPVLDAQNRPIEIAERGKVRIDVDGMITQDGVEVALLGLVSVPDTDSLERVGAGMYRPGEDQIKRRTPGTGELVQAHVEESGVDEIEALMAVTNAGREVDSNVAMIQQHDRLMERAIQSLGRTV